MCKLFRWVPIIGIFALKQHYIKNDGVFLCYLLWQSLWTMAIGSYLLGTIFNYFYYGH